MEWFFFLSLPVLGGLVGWALVLRQQNTASKTLLTEAHGKIKALDEELFQLQRDCKQMNEAINQKERALSAATEANKYLREKQESQQKDMELMGERMKLEFEHLATRILDQKSEKFTRLNKENLEGILKPLGENLDSFRKKVEDVYDKESKERFSLGKEVQRLMELNQKVSEEASNLTNALKGSSKIQGDWGQMILENILEQSGLERDREYFVQDFLKDEDGRYFTNDSGRKMQPDVIIQYPDQRKVIVDSKVSLTAYTRYVEAEESSAQQLALKEHLISLRKHVDDLSSKSYQDFAAGVDFVMMFVPVEPAYLLALKSDHDLWNYAYKKRVLLISPTNLIAALKLIEDLWKREYQNRNAQEIAERGASLYDKLVGFVESLSGVGTHLDRARQTYEQAYSQLHTGRGNLIRQAEMLRELGVKSKKNLPSSLKDSSENQ